MLNHPARGQRKPHQTPWWGVALVLVIGAAWAINTRNANGTAAFDRVALNYANQLLQYQVMLEYSGQAIQPTLARLRQVSQPRGAWQDAPAGVVVLEPASRTTYCFAVRHARGSRWYLVYEDLGTAREMPDSATPPSTPPSCR